MGDDISDGLKGKEEEEEGEMGMRRERAGANAIETAGRWCVFGIRVYAMLRLEHQRLRFSIFRYVACSSFAHFTYYSVQ